MAYYINGGRKRKKNVFLIIFITITLIGVIATAVLTGGFFYVSKLVEESRVNIEEMQKSTVNLQQQIDTSKEQIKLYDDQLESLNKQLVRFEPVVIPDSMKKE